MLPAQSWPIRTKIPTLENGQTSEVRLGPFELLMRRDGDDLLVWPALCPHEGAKLDESHLCDDRLSCPWHGRRFRPARLKSSGEGALRYLGLSITLHNGELIAAPASRDASTPQPAMA
jgi:hypothetical protein